MQVKTSWKDSISLSNFILNYMRFWRIISSFSRKGFQTYEIINGKMIKLLVCFSNFIRNENTGTTPRACIT